MTATNERVQIIVSPARERLAVIPEHEYLMLLAASEDDEGEPAPEFLAEIRRRSQAFLQTRSAKIVEQPEK
jgi:hypothetical protein